MDLKYSRNLIKAAALVAVGITAAMSSATAATLTFSGSVASTLTDWAQNINITKFDSGLGTLTGIEITVTTSATTSITVENTSLSSSSGNVRTEITLSLLDPSGFLVGSNPFIDGFIPSVAATYSLNAGESVVLGPYSRNLSSGPVDYSDSDILSEFTGVGNIVLTGTTFTQTLLGNSGGNTSSSQVTTANANVKVVYTYDAVPEPGTYALLGLGLGAGGVAYLRNRRSAVKA